jgi:ubiquinone/menaquinone biosynthesis C-methylase UbiE
MTMDPVQATNAAAQEVFGRRAGFYRTSPVHADPQVLARLVALAAPEPDWTALDLATGTGHTARALAPHVRRVIGFDLTRAMLVQAVEHGQEMGTSAPNLCQGDVYRLPFASCDFDLATCRRAAHHFGDLAQALREMRRVLRPGGRVIVDDRSVPDDGPTAALMNQLDLLHDPSHVREYSAPAWQAMLLEAGFSVERVENYEMLRPLADLTAGVEAPQANEIQQLVEHMDSTMAKAFGRSRNDGQWHIRHWYVMLAAVAQ